jgi:hypothetical protein
VPLQPRWFYLNSPSGEFRPVGSALSSVCVPLSDLVHAPLEDPSLYAPEPYFARTRRKPRASKAASFLRAPSNQRSQLSCDVRLRNGDFVRRTRARIQIVLIERRVWRGYEKEELFRQCVGRGHILTIPALLPSKLTWRFSTSTRVRQIIAASILS